MTDLNPAGFFLSGMITCGPPALGLALFLGPLGLPIPTALLVLVAGAFARQGMLEGYLDGNHWSLWFDGMTVTVDENGDTVLHGPVADQSALYGLLARLRDLALPLLSVNRIELGAE